MYCMVLARVLFCVQNPKSTVVMQCAMFSKIPGRPSDFFHSRQSSSRNRGRGDIHTESPSKVLLQKTQKGAIYKLCHVQKKFICYLYEYIYIFQNLSVSTLQLSFLFSGDSFWLTFSHKERQKG